MCVSWWNSTDQVNAEPPSAPSSGSLAVPVKAITSPARYIAPPAGEVTVIWAVGGRFAVAVSTASALVAEPEALLTTTRNRAPSSVADTEAIV